MAFRPERDRSILRIPPSIFAALVIYNSLATPNSVTRNFQQRNFTATPPGLLQYRMGHAGEGMSELYGKIKGDVRFRKEVGEKAGLRFELPNEFSSWTEWTETRKIPA